MTAELERLQDWLRICLIVTSICTTAFPILYAFTPWYRSVLGRLLMLQSVAFSAAIDFTLLFQYWTPTVDDLMTIFWIQAAIFTLLAGSTLLMTWTMVRMNYFRHKRKKASQHD